MSHMTVASLVVISLNHPLHCCISDNDLPMMRLLIIGIVESPAYMCIWFFITESLLPIK